MIQAQIYFDKERLLGPMPLHGFIMKLLLQHGISGATSFVGYSGLGKQQVLQQPGQQFSFDETPMLITFIDEEAKVNAVLTELRQHYKGGFIVTHPVTRW